MLAGTTQRIHMLGTDRLCRGIRLEDGSRPGDVLLRGALEHLKAAGSGRMPVVSALVTPENGRSRALFDRNGFSPLKYSGEGELIYVRAPTEATAVLFEEVPPRWIASGSRRSHMTSAPLQE